MLIVSCPHCNDPVEIAQINCGIFRHGVYKHNYEPIPPHSSQSECNRLVFEGEIYGCGKPFQIRTEPSGQLTVFECDYI